LLASAGLGRIAQGEAMPAGEFNQQVAAAQARGEGWTASASCVALKLVGDGYKPRLISEARVRSRVEVTVTDQGAEDASIRGYRFRVALQKGPEGFWQICGGWPSLELLAGSRPPGLLHCPLQLDAKPSGAIRDDDVTVMASRGSDIGPDPGL